MAFTYDPIHESNYGKEQLNTLGPLNQSDNVCRICYLISSKNKNHEFKNRNVLYKHMIEKHEELIKKASQENSIKSQEFMNILNAQKSKEQVLYEAKRDVNSVQYKIDKINEDFLIYFFMNSRQQADIPGVSLGRNVDISKYTTIDSINEAVNIISDFDQSKTLKELNKKEPGASYLPFDIGIRNLSIEALSSEAWDYYQKTKIDKLRKVQYQYMFDLIKEEIKHLKGEYPIFNSLIDREMYDRLHYLFIERFDETKNYYFAEQDPNHENLDGLVDMYEQHFEMNLEFSGVSESMYVDKMVPLANDLNLEVIGSVAYGLANKESNLDLAIFVNNADSQKWLIFHSYSILKRLSKQLKKNKDFSVTILVDTRVPTLQIKHKSVPFACNIIMAHYANPLRTIVMRHYVDNREFFAPMVIYLKKWARSKKLDTLNYSLNYNICVMLVAMVLNDKMNPMPVLRMDPMKPARDISFRLDIGKPYYPVIDQLEDLSSIGFYSFCFFNDYGGVNITYNKFTSFDFDTSAVTLSKPTVYSKRSEIYAQFSDDALVILDFNLADNVAKTLTQEQLVQFRWELRKMAFNITYRKNVNKSCIDF